MARDPSHRKPPDPDCYFCHGSGAVLAHRAHFLSAGQECLCTVSQAGMLAALPGVIDDILERCKDQETTKDK